MKHLLPRISFILIITFFLFACSPHSGAGVWKAIAENDKGISRLVVGYEGRAEFTSNNDINWHCFWGAPEKNLLSLDCSPSTETEKKTVFTLTVNDQDLAELRDGTNLLATFIRLDENPSPQKE